MRTFFKILLGFLLVVFIILVASVRTVDRRPYEKSDYFKQTLKNIQNAEEQLRIGDKTTLLAGCGKAGITPPVGVPMAGYGARKGAPSEGVHDSLYVRVIALKAGDRLACLIGFDVLIFNPPIARKFEKLVQKKLNLQPDQFYYTATHTHSGPGGWSNGFVEEQFAGKPDERVPVILIDSTLVAVQRAVSDLQPAEYGVGKFVAPEFTRNRLVGDKGQIDPEMVFLALRRKNKLKAIFATYSAHATVLSAKNMLLSGDYPGYFERKLEAATGAMTAFAAAGLGSHSPRGKGSGFERARYIGEGLADSLLKYLGKITFHPQVSFRYTRIPVKIHDLQIRISENLRLAPWLAGKLFHIEDSYLSVLALDNFILFGSPGEFSGELALKVKAHAKKKNILTTITSFNGCYIGYVTPSEYYHLKTYETRLMSFFGPYTGDYLVDVMNRVIDVAASR